MVESSALAKIVVIEDYPPLRMAICELLRDAGFDPVPAENGIAGMKCIREVGAQLVITDISMPQQDGIETIRAIRQAHGPLPIIAVSGRYGAAGSLADAVVFGADVTLEKPFQNADLLDAVVRLL